jgi:hypothetical protein
LNPYSPSSLCPLNVGISEGIGGRFKAYIKLIIKDNKGKIKAMLRVVTKKSQIIKVFTFKIWLYKNGALNLFNF